MIARAGTVAIDHRTEARARFTSASPLARLIEAVDVAETVRFLASGAAAGITGEDVNVSAGAVMY